jgi:acyl dehydratase
MLLSFDTPPAMWRRYPRILFGRKSSHVERGASVPRIAASLSRLAIDGEHLARYRRVCGYAPSEYLPVAYPHVLAMPLHITMLSSAAFPVRLLGLVQVRNHIEQRRPIRASETARLNCWIEGHREVERGQEFEIFTEVVAADGATAWREICTFLARGRGRAAGEGGSSSARMQLPAVPAGSAAHASRFQVKTSVGRSYGFVSGDLNPIHLFGFTARAFGFERAVAHGMWSLARCTAELGEGAFAQACVLEVQFRRPLYLPGSVTLENWRSDDITGFALRDDAGRAHLFGRLQSVA